MNVYLVYAGSYEDREVISVHATLEGAQQDRGSHGHAPTWEDGSGHWRCSWRVVHHSAKVPVSVAFQTEVTAVIDGVATLPDGRRIAVPPGHSFVSTPNIPRDYVPFRPDWTETCDIEIEERSVGA